mmetsp:Transcript_1129/g.2457  ORF Transcript_1129/g.2457 Transcript_1129/m.2457 type:complete len:304 (+) Transcript_1129:2110-3021(+)
MFRDGIAVVGDHLVRRVPIDGGKARLLCRLALLLCGSDSSPGRLLQRGLRHLLKLLLLFLHLIRMLGCELGHRKDRRTLSAPARALGGRLGGGGGLSSGGDGTSGSGVCLGGSSGGSRGVLLHLLLGRGGRRRDLDGRRGGRRGRRGHSKLVVPPTLGLLLLVRLARGYEVFVLPVQRLAAAAGGPGGRLRFRYLFRFRLQLRFRVGIFVGVFLLLLRRRGLLLALLLVRLAGRHKVFILPVQRFARRRRRGGRGGFGDLLLLRRGLGVGFFFVLLARLARGHEVVILPVQRLARRTRGLHRR